MQRTIIDIIHHKNDLNSIFLKTIKNANHLQKYELFPVLHGKICSETCLHFFFCQMQYQLNFLHNKYAHTCNKTSSINSKNMQWRSSRLGRQAWTSAVTVKDICGIFAWNVLEHSIQRQCLSPLYGWLPRCSAFWGMLGIISFLWCTSVAPLRDALFDLCTSHSSDVLWYFDTYFPVYIIIVFGRGTGPT